MQSVIEVIMYRTREGVFEFRAIIDGKDFESLEGTQIAMTLEAISEQHGGFRYNEDRKAFETMTATTGAEPLQLISELERQGYTVIMHGSLEHIDNLQAA